MDRCCVFLFLDVSLVADKPSFTVGLCRAETFLDAEFFVPCGVDYN